MNFKHKPFGVLSPFASAPWQALPELWACIARGFSLLAFPAAYTLLIIHHTRGQNDEG